MPEPAPAPVPPEGTPAAAAPALPGAASSVRRAAGLAVVIAALWQIPWILSTFFHASVLVALAVLVTTSVLSTDLRGGVDVQLVAADDLPASSAAPKPETAISEEPFTERRLQEILDTQEPRTAEAPDAVRTSDSNRVVKSLETLVRAAAPRLSARAAAAAEPPPLTPGDLEASEAIARLLEEGGAEEPAAGTTRPALAPPALAAGRAGTTSSKESEEIRQLGEQLRNGDHRNQHKYVTALLAYGTSEAIDQIVYSLGSISRCPRHQATRALQGMTGQDFGEDTEGWRQWWEANRARFSPDEVLAKRLESLAAQLRAAGRGPEALKVLAELSQIESPLAVGVIIEALPALSRDSKAADYAYSVLKDRTGKDLPHEPGAWKQWWAANGDTLKKKS